MSETSSAFLIYEKVLNIDSILPFDSGDIGVLPPLGVYDPLGLIETRDMRRYEIMEV